MTEIKNLLVNEYSTMQFLINMLPELEKDEVFIILAFARKKYNPKVKDEWLFHRDIIRNNDVDEIIRKIRRSAYFDNTFIDFKTEEPIPMDAFVYYIDLSPKSTIKAWNLFSKETNARIYQILQNPEEVIHMRKLKNNLMSAIHRSNSRKPYILLDIDTKDEKMLKQVCKIVGKWEWISETRGGYHVIVKKTREMSTKIYKNIIAPMRVLVEIKSDVMTPVVGTLQGGWEVKKKFVDIT
jgi:ribosomal protein S10